MRSAKSIYEKVTTRYKFSWWSLSGDSLKCKKDSLLMEAIIGASRLGRYDDVAVVVHPDNFIVLVDCVPNGYVGGEFKEEFKEEPFLTDKFSGTLKFPSYWHLYESLDIPRNEILVYKMSRCDDILLGDYSFVLSLDDLPLPEETCSENNS